MAWDYWVASLAHLRPQSDVPPARILAVEGSAAVPQHELLIFAVSRDTQPDPDNLLPSCTLLGPPLSFQFGSCGEDDAEAVALVQWIVEAVVNGHMSPDDDARSAWRMLLDGGRPQWLRRQATPDDPDTD
jgi:hypothetical protein